MFDFKGKNYIITGAAGSIGRAVTEIVVDLGGSVFALDADGETLKEMAEQLPENQFSYRNIDLSTPERIRDAFSEIISRFGTLHGLVNCVGILTLDHIIVAGDKTYSMIQHGDIDYRCRR